MFYILEFIYKKKHHETLSFSKRIKQPSIYFTKFGSRAVNRYCKVALPKAKMNNNLILLLIVGQCGKVVDKNCVNITTKLLPH